MTRSVLYFARNFDEIQEIKRYLDVLLIDLLVENDRLNEKKLRNALYHLDNAIISWAFDMKNKIDSKKPLQEVNKEKIVKNLSLFLDLSKEIFENYQDLKEFSQFIIDKTQKIINSADEYIKNEITTIFDKEQQAIKDLRSKIVIITSKMIS